MDACKRGDFKQAMKLLPEVGALQCVEDNYALRNTFVSSSSEDWQWTPFHYAAKYGELEFIRDFFNLFSSSLVNALTKRIIPRRTGLTGETICWHPKSVSGYKDLHFGPRLKISQLKDGKGLTPLHIACGHGHLRILHFYINIVKCDLQCRDNLGRTPFHYASEQGHVRIVQCLIKDGLCEPNCCDSNQQTPLQIANDVGQTAIHVVDYMTNSESGMCECINSDGNLETSTNAACDRFDSSKVPLLPAHAANTLENRALAIVCPKGLKERTLPQSCGCSIDVDAKGRTKLHIACGKRYIEVVKALLSSCAHHINIQDKNGRTALHFACSSLFGACKRKDIVAYLLATKECDPSITDNKGRNVLHISCDVGDPELVSTLLINSNIDINAQDENGKIPLHYVLESKMSRKTCQDIVKILLSYEQCDLNVVDINGCTPLEVALYKQSFKMFEMLQLLIKNSSNADESTMQLHLACARGHCDSVHTMLSDDKFRAALQSRDVTTALHISCASREASSSSHKWKTIIRELLAHPHCKISATDHYGRNDLHISCIHGNAKITSLLLSIDQSVINVQDRKGRTPLHYASMLMHSNTSIQLLLDCENCDTTLVDDDGNTPLQMALSRKTNRAVRLLLLSSKCNPNTNINGYTPLHLVCEEGDLELVSLILSDREYRSDMQCSDGKTPLHSVCSSSKVSVSKRLKIVRILLAHQPSLVSAIDNTGCTALHFAVTTGDSETMSLLLSTEASLINVQDDQCQTPLHYACLNAGNNQEKVIKLLLAYNKCDPNVVDKYGNTSLQRALFEQNYKAVKQFLLSSKYNPNTNINGYTPLHFVCEEGDLELVSLILSDREYRSDMQCSDGKTPLHSVCSSSKVSFPKRSKIVRMLLAHQPSLVSAIDNTGCTALHFAVTTGDSETMSLLLSTEASLINVQDDQGQTPLHYACLNTRGINKKVIKLLLARNECDPHIVDNNGNTPLQIVLFKQNYKAVKQFLLSSKCNPNTNINGYTPLHFVCEEGDLKLVSLILSDREYRSDMQCSDGKTPLHSVCSSSKVSVSKRLKIVRKLLAHQPNLVSAIDNTGCTALHFAVTRGDSETVSLLLSTKASLINVQDDRGQTPLHYACLKTRNNQEKVVKLLLGDLELVSLILSDREYRSDMQCSDGKTILHSVCSSKMVSVSKRSKIVRMLLAHRPSIVSAIDNTGCTALHFAVTTGDSETMSLLLSTEANLINVQDDQGQTPLHYACSNTRESNEEVVKLLLAYNKCDPNVVDKYGNTPLQRAQNYKAVKQFLLSSKYNPNTNINGYTPLHLVCEEGDLKLVSLILSDREYRSDMQCSDGKTPLHSACSSSKVFVSKISKIVTMLLAHQPSLVAVIDNTGCTALHFAVTTGDSETMSLLLSTEASLINVQDDQGQTPLHYACSNTRGNNEEVVKHLLARNECDPNVVDNNGNTPLQIVLFKQNYKAVKQFLLSSKCNPNTNINGYTPLHSVCEEGDLELVSLILSDREYRSDMQCSDGKTPLHSVCSSSKVSVSKRYEIVRMLLAHQPSLVSAIDNTGCTALHFAVTTGDSETMSLLLSSKASLINVQDDQCQTPLHYACLKTRESNEEVVKLLLAHNKCDPNVVDKYGNTPLQRALFEQNYKAVKQFLLSSKCNPNTNINGYTPLHSVCEEGDLELVSLILSDREYRSDMQCSDGKTPLHSVYSSSKVSFPKRLKIVRMLLAHQPSLVSAIDNTGRTVLHFAVTTGDSETMSLLLSTEASLINVQDDHGQTPLHYACLNTRGNNEEVIKLLLARNECDPHIVDNNGNTPLQMVLSRQNHRAVKQFLLSSKCNPNTNINGYTPLHLVCEEGDLELVSLILSDREYRSDMQCSDGKTPLHSVCSSKMVSVSKRSKIVTMLLAHQPSLVSAIDNTGRTALHFAVTTGDSETMSLLLSTKASLINVQDDQCQTPLHYACLKTRESNEEVVKLLLAYNKCDPNVVDKYGNTPLQRALFEQNYKAVKQFLLSSKYNPNTNINGYTPLHFVCEEGDLELVSLILSDREYRSDMQCSDGKTPLHSAYSSSKVSFPKRLKIVRMLLAHQPSLVSAIDNTGRTVLHFAVTTGDSETMSLLLSTEASLINVQDDHGQTPLHYACLNTRGSNKEVIKLLLARNECDPHIVDNNGNTPLQMVLSRQNHRAVKQFLLSSKYNPNTNINGYTPLHLVCKEGDLELVSLILSDREYRSDMQCSDGKTPLHSVCSSSKVSVSKRLKIVRKLLAHQPSLVSAIDNTGCTALHFAVTRGDSETVSLLLATKASLINVQDDQCQTPLHYACLNTRNNQEKVIKLLLTYNKCDPNVVDKYGNTPLQRALSEQNYKAVRLLLLSSKCNPNTNINGYSPLHLVCEEGDLELVSLILSDREYRSDMQCSDGKTPLHSVCSSSKVSVSKRSKIVRILLAHQPSLVSAIDNTGRTALHFAVTTGDSETMSLLLSTEASLINVQDYQCQTPLHYACSNTRGNNEEVIKLLLARNECDPHIVDNNGNTPLQIILSRQNHRAVKQFLLSSKCNPNTNINGYTPLHLVCEEGDLELVSLILSDREYRSDMQCSDGKTPLHSVCSSKMVSVSKRSKIVTMLLAHQPSLVSAIDNTGRTALHFAVTTGDSETMSLLLSTKASLINVQDDQCQTPLHYACLKTRESNEEVVKLLLAYNKCDPNVVDKYGNTPLQRALFEQNYKAVKQFLLSSNCNPNTNINGYTPLHLVCEEGDLELVSLILSDREYRSDMQCSDGKTPLHSVCSSSKVSVSNRYEIVRMLLAHQPSLVSAIDNTGCTALHFAVTTGDSETMSLLLSTEASLINVQDDQGLTPLHCACFRTKNNHLLKLLLAYNECDPNLIDKYGYTPFKATVMTHNYNATHLLMENSKCDLSIGFHPLNPLQYACVKNDTLMVSIILSSGKFQVNAQDPVYGRTALHYACNATEIDEELVKALTAERECDISIADHSGETILQIAFKRELYKIIRILLLSSQKLISDVVNKTFQDSSILHVACAKSDYEMIECLVSIENYILNIQDENGMNPLHIACKRNDIRAVRILLFHCGTSLINVLDSQGQTPLHYACLKIRGTNEVVKLLLSHIECDLNIVDEDGNTPFKATVMTHNYNATHLLMENSKCDLSIGFHPLNPLQYACVENDTRMVSIILSSGKVQVNAQDPVYGKTALHYACSATEINQELVKALTAGGKCDISITDHSGETILQIALKRKLYRIIRILVLSSQKSILDKVINNTFEGFSILHVACAKSDYEMIECLVSIENCLLNIQDENGMNPLHIACKRNDIRAVRLLLSNVKCDTTVLDKYGKSAVEYTHDYDILRELFRHGANPSPLYHRYVLNRRKIPSSFVKVFVLGDSGVGKTTLVESLQREYLALRRAIFKYQRISEVELKTAGIVPTDFKSKEYGQVTLFDFAGQKQYFGTHEAFLNSAFGTCPPIFVLVIDVSANQALDKKLLYWSTFLKSTCSHLSVKPHIIIICSHVDVLNDANKDPLARFSVIEQVMTSCAFSWCHFAGIVGMDCRLPNSSDMLILRQIMKRSCDTLRIKSRMDFNCHCFFVYLLDKFRESLAITIDMVQAAIQTEPEASKSGESHLSFIPDTVSRLCQICDKLDDHGHIIFIKDSTQLEMSWIIIDKVSLFNKVTGAIFAPEGFKENFNLSTSTGVVPFSKMKGKFFPEYDIEMLMSFLSHMEFCNEVTDRKLLKLLTEGQSISATDRYFFFPLLVTVDAPSDVWSSDTQCEFRFGWCLKCRDADFFTPRFLQVLILRLAFIYALASDTQHSGTDSLPLPVIHRKCQVWKNGIFWGTKEGIECLVSIDEDNKMLLLLMKSPTINQACLKYRSTLLTKIMCIKEDVMCGLKAVKYVIDSQYPLPPVNAISLDEINEVIIECDEAVVTSTGKIFTVDHLLVFEPYAKLGKEILKQLFCSQNRNLKISDEFLLRLASQWVERKMMIMKVFNPDPILLSGKIREMNIPGPASEILCTLQLWRDIDGDNEGTYKCLREKLDQFSICCGINPLVSVFISNDIDHIHKGKMYTKWEP